MQRAGSSPSSTPSTPAEPPSKKQRLSSGSYNFTPSSTPRSDAQAAQDALAADEWKRRGVIEREGADRGETKWYLSLKEPEAATTASPLRIVSAGYSSLDTAGSTREQRSEEDEQEKARRPQVVGRRSFGRFNKAVEVCAAHEVSTDQAYWGRQKQQNPDLSSSASDSEVSHASGASEDESDDPTGAKALITQSRKEAGEKARVDRKAKKKADRAEAARLAEDRRKKQVKLNGLTSISGNTGGSSGARDMICHGCGGKGHMRKDCPQASQQRARRK